mmetsp:Transcript_23476/g.79934  ORF Transcript_23476/g.79934 Transcript_23476/m.79934 type:complete len:226 (-) Transcript_23476:1236-1913(-)
MSLVGAARTSKMWAHRSSRLTSRAPPLSAAHFCSARVYTGRNCIDSGKMSLPGPADDAPDVHMRNSLSACAVFCCTTLRASSRRDTCARSAASRATSATMASTFTALNISPTVATTGTASVCTLIRRSPPDVVYSSAHCRKHVVSPVAGLSVSCEICTPNALSALAAGRASRSVDLMKKWPWKELILNPRLHRIRTTLSHAVSRRRLCLSSESIRGPSLSRLKPG